MLKQSAFTFNFSAAAASGSTPNSTGTTTRATPSASTSSPAEGSGSGRQTDRPSPKNASPQQLGLNVGSNNGVSGYTPLLSFSNLNDSNASAISPSTSANATNTPPLVFFSPPPTHAVPSPYTTIASNPMYTSYTDFSGWEQFFAETALDQTLAGVTMPSGNNSGNLFGGQQLQQQQTPLPSMLSPPSAGGTNGSGSMEDLFSSTGNYSDLIPFSGFSPTPGASSDSPVNHTVPMTGVTSTSTTQPQQNYDAFALSSRDVAQKQQKPSLAPRSSSPCGGADPDEAPIPGSAAYQPEFASAMYVGGSAKTFKPSAPANEHKDCPKSKEEMQKLIASEPLSTFGSVPGLDTALADIASGKTPEEKDAKMKEAWQALQDDPRFLVSP